MCSIQYYDDDELGVEILALELQCFRPEAFGDGQCEGRGKKKTQEVCRTVRCESRISKPRGGRLVGEERGRRC